MELNFPVYLYDLNRKSRLVFSYPNSVLSEDQINELSQYLEKGAIIQIHESYLEEFLELKLVEWDEMKQWNKERLDIIEIYERRKKRLESVKDEKLILKDIIKQKNCFHLMREKIIYDLLEYPLDQSEVVNFTLCLIEKLFVREAISVKNACLSYFIAQNYGIKDQETLIEILLAALTKDLGFCMVAPSVLNSKDKINDDYYQKHPYLSLFYLSKLDLPLSKDLKRYIMEHHENVAGEGFPRGKKEEFTSKVSYILNLCEQVVWHGETQKKELHSTLKYFANKSEVDGLDTKLPDLLLDQIKGIV